MGYLKTTNLNLDFYLDMVSYRRKQDSKYQAKFCNRYLKPVFGNPDEFGNYTLIVGEKPSIAFMAHHDTVHKTDGRSKVEVMNEFVVSGDDDVLGADCTTGIFIILRMIQENVPGVYVVHAAEEVGCIGSRALVKSNPAWFSHVKAAISLDRMGYSSVITHQAYGRTCSDSFAESVADILSVAGLDGYKCDPTGVYTDSNEYAGIIPECTNLSVGYFKQHSVNEHQDWEFMIWLADAMIAADWTKIDVSRDPLAVDTTNYYKQSFGGWGDWDDLSYREEHGLGPKKTHSSGLRSDNLEGLEEVVQKYPLQVAKLLNDMGYSVDGLMDDVGDYLSQRVYY